MGQGHSWALRFCDHSFSPRREQASRILRKPDAPHTAAHIMLKLIPLSFEEGDIDLAMHNGYLDTAPGQGRLQCILRSPGTWQRLVRACPCKSSGSVGLARVSSSTISTPRCEASWPNSPNISTSRCRAVCVCVCVRARLQTAQLAIDPTLPSHRPSVRATHTASPGRVRRHYLTKKRDPRRRHTMCSIYPIPLIHHI